MQEKTFADFGLAEPIIRAVTEAGYVSPTPIQAESIPHLMEGKDLLGCAQTGTGKTAAFALPILNNLAKKPRHIERRQVRVLILSPTRELALQIHESFETYGKNLRLKTSVIFGGVSQNIQVRQMNAGVDILVATPGRLLDLIQQKYVNLSNIDTFVLDEADRMLDMGFINDIRKIMNLLPKKRQTLLFSATMPREIQTLAESLLTNPVKVQVAPVSSTSKQIEQRVMFVDKAKKRDLLLHVLKDRDASRVIVFTRTKHGANRIVEMLSEAKIPSEAIHGNKAQGARQRALLAFRSGKVRVLVATDVMARGIDVDGVTHVINFDIPTEPESYVHRIGRTGRAEATGVAIAFCEGDERFFMRNIEKLVNASIMVVLDQPYHSDAAANAKGLKSMPHGRNNSGANGPRRGGPRRPPSGGGGPRGGGSGSRGGARPQRSNGGPGRRDFRRSGPSTTASRD